MIHQLSLRLILVLIASLIIGLGIGVSLSGWMDRKENTVQLPVATGTVVIGTGEADVEGGVLSLSPAIPGRVAVILAREGIPVRKGDPLLVLDSEDARDQLLRAKTAVETASLQVTAAGQSKLEHRAELEKIQFALKAAQLRVEIQQGELQRLERLQTSSLVGKPEIDTGRKMLRSLELTADGELAKLKHAETIDTELTVKIAQSQLSAAKTAEEAAQRQVDRCTLKAPEDGFVLRVAAQVGQTFTALTPETAIWLRPERPWVIRCEIDQQYMDRVTIGMPCDIFDEGSDTARWQGTVTSKGQWVTLRRPRAEDPFGRRDQRAVECLIRVTNPEGLLVGQRVRVVVRTTTARDPGTPGTPGNPTARAEPESRTARE